MQKYNLNSLKEQCGDDKKFFNEMLDVFESSARDGIKNMQQALMLNDMDTVKHYAHKVVSPFRHIEAHHIVSKLKNVEMDAQRPDMKDKCADLIGEIKQDTEELIAGLKGEYL